MIALAMPTAAAARSNDSLALEALRNYAVCAVGRTPAGAVKLLELDPMSREFGQAARRYAKGHGGCMGGGGRLGFDGLPFAGDLAEAVIARHYPGASLAAAAAGEVTPRYWAEAIGVCVARARPDAVAAVLETKPGSDAEVEALKPTGAVLPGCIPNGRTLSLNRPAVRAIYALGAYRLLSAPTTATKQAGGG